MKPRVRTIGSTGRRKSNLFSGEWLKCSMKEIDKILVIMRLIKPLMGGIT